MQNHPTSRPIPETNSGTSLWETEQQKGGSSPPRGLGFPVEMRRMGMDSQGLSEPTLCPSDPGPRSLLCPVEQERA